MVESCETCRFFRDTNRPDGRCHLRAPRFFSEVKGDTLASYFGEEGVWPRVARSDWCGEYQTADTTEPDDA